MDTNNIHLARLVSEKADMHPHKTAIRFCPIGDTTWQKLSWADYALRVDQIAISLYSLGIQEKDRIGQFSQNMVENLILDSAIWSNRAIMVPIYATSSESQTEFIINDSEMRIICVGEQEQYDIVNRVIDRCPKLAHIVVFDPHVKLLQDNGRSLYFHDLIEAGKQNSSYLSTIRQRRAAALQEDLFAIFYTSGTTGKPKGVMLAHEGATQQIINHYNLLPPLRLPRQRSICYLPLTHIFERMWTYVCLASDVQVIINLRPQEIRQTLKRFPPTMMCAVPRFWEKVYIAVREQINHSSPLKLGMFAWALMVGHRHNIDYLRIGKKPPFWLATQYRLVDRFVFRKVKHTVGIQRGTMFPAAGAAMSKDVAEFFLSIGVPIVHGYGLTETTATVACYPPVNYSIGSIGDIIPGVEVKISEEGEICVKGPIVTKGYYNNPDANAKAFTQDGYFRTGDVGYIKDGHLFMTERSKDLFKTSNGKYIAPQQIEMALTSDPYFEQVAVIGDSRPYVTALIVPNLTTLRQHANDMGWSEQDTYELLHNPAVLKFYENRIRELQKDRAHFEVIKRFRFIPQGFTMATGELTNTLKLRRSIIQNHYRDMIDEMYAK